MILLLSPLLILAGILEQPALQGTFIQYSRGYLGHMDASKWEGELENARRAGLNIIAVQRLADNRGSYVPDSAGGLPANLAFDPTEILMNFADKNRMQVFLGLAEDDRWWNSSLDDNCLAELAAKNIETAGRAHGLYGGHASFAGWYIPQEPWDAYPQDRVETLAKFFRQIGDGCRKLADKPVCIAPFFTAKVTPEVFGRFYAALLASSGVDVVMLQDGVGARGLDQKVESVVPYFEAMRHACKISGISLWADVEIFTRDFRPCGCERLIEQMRVHAPYVEKMVAFEFFHYMSPTRGESSRALYEGYLRYLSK
jgi:hypothetical protein